MYAYTGDLVNNHNRYRLSYNDKDNGIYLLHSVAYNLVDSDSLLKVLLRYI